MTVDRIAECARGDELPLLDVRWIVVHHTSLARAGTDNPTSIHDLDLDGPKLARRFRERAALPPAGLGTGGRVPYHLLVLRSGAVDQMLPLSVRGVHAKGYNARSVAIAYVGEDGGPLAAQQRSLVRVCRALLLWAGPQVQIVGHTDLPGASRDPAKRCPGPGLYVPSLAAGIVDRLPDGWRQWAPHGRSLALRAEGLVERLEAA